MPPNRFESEVESFLEGSHGDRTHIKRADHPRLHHYAGRYSCEVSHPRAGHRAHVRISGPTCAARSAGSSHAAGVKGQKELVEG